MNHFDWRTQWQSWLEWPPPHTVIQVWREGWPGPRVYVGNAVPEHWDRHGMYWRLSGIGREVIAVSGL